MKLGSKTKRQLVRCMTVLGMIGIAFAFSHCDSKSSDDDEAASETVVTDGSGTSSTSSTEEIYDVEEAIPSDSTGVSSDLLLGFSTASTEDGFSLTDSVSQIAISDTVTVTTAQLCIAGIKVKANRERTREEVRLQAKEKSDEEEIAAEEETFKTEMASVEASYRERVRAAKGQDTSDLQAEMVREKKELKAKRAEERKQKDQEKLAIAEGRDKSMKWTGPFVYDALSGVSTPELPAISLVDGSYQRIEYQLRQYRDGDADSPLLNNTFYVGGTVILDSVSVPFEISYHMAENIRLSGSGSLKVEANESNAMLMSFDVKSWFAGISFASATISESGSIIIDKTNNHDILMQIKKNIKTYTRFGKDVDGDGSLKLAEKAGDGEVAVSEDGE